jgi:hypothetical protein
MNKQEFLKLIKNPSLTTAGDSEKLEALVANFPYCQSAHLLIAKIAHQQSSMLSRQKLSKAAAYVLDRKKLKKILIMPPAPEPAQGSVPENPLPVIAPPATPEAIENIIIKPEEKQQESATPEVSPVAEEISSRKMEQEKTEEVQKEIVPTAGTIDEIRKDVQEKKEGNAVQSKNELVSPVIMPKITLENPMGNASTKISSAFFTELEQNLQNLKKFREENEKKTFVNPPKKFPSKESDSERFQAYDAAAILPPILPARSKEEIQPKIALNPRYVIYSSRLEDVFSSPEEANSGAHQEDIVWEYLNFLSSRKKILFRSREKVNSIIEKFITEEPSIPHFNKTDVPENSEDLSEDNTNTRVSNHIASENFARILVRQGKHKKAIAIYNELILKNPEKKAYFAVLIEELNNKL